MSAEPESLLRSLADEMALLLSDSHGAKALSLLQRFGVLDPSKEKGTKAPDCRLKEIGVWEAGPRGYERSETRRSQWTRWADVPYISPKGKRKRVALLGESVARGYFYDPELTPAQALELCLTTLLGEPIEVVDLAKIDLLAPELIDLSSAALALEPDAMVLFAGNNWFAFDERDRFLEATALRERGVLGLKELREQRLSSLVEGTLRPHFNLLSTSLPVVLVIPEFNLADWRLDADADAPWLPLGKNRRWLVYRADARSALASGCLDAARSLAREMVELDGGTAASGWTILADCARRQGDLPTARSCLEKARDSQIWNNTPQTPRALSISQQGLRESALPGRIAVVDLPHCFAGWQNGELPGSRLFLDYCHLTSEGIRIAMAAAASELAILLGADRSMPDLESLVEAIPVPRAGLEAEARFAAAIHSAHWGQQLPVVSLRCEEAAQRSPEVARAMREYLEIQTRRAPNWACTATERFSALSTPALRRYVLTYSRTKLFDPVLLPAIAYALEKTGLASVDFLDELRKEERGVSDRPLDLLDPYYRSSWADRNWLGWPTHFCRVYSPRSRFPWVSRASRPVEFEITCRRTDLTITGDCPVCINGVRVTHVSLGLEWATFRFSAPDDAVKAGVNWLEIDWTLELGDSSKEIERIAFNLEKDRPIPLLPVFAEIFSLKVVEC